MNEKKAENLSISDHQYTRVDRKRNYHDVLLEILDALYAAIIVGPLVVSFWRGTWALLIIYIYPSDLVISSCISLTIGIATHLVFTIFKSKIKKILHPENHRLSFYILSRFYTYFYAVMCVNCWRGYFQLLDIYMTNASMINMLTFVSVIFLCCIKSIRNVIAPPYVICTDAHERYFFVPTYLKKSGSREPGLYVLDCIFSVLVIGSLVVFVWRGLWVLLDLRLFPKDHTLSAWGSFFIGYGIVGVTFSLQPLMRWACERLEGFWRVAVADVFLFFSFIGTVNVWRGVWQLLDIYFLPENNLLSDWITHGVSLLLLMLLNCSNSVLVRGVYIDAEEPAGQCVIFPVYYIRLFFQKERSKKQKRLLESLEKGDHPNNISFIAKTLNNNRSALSASSQHNHKIVRSMEELPLDVTNIELEIKSKNNIVSGNEKM